MWAGIESTPLEGKVITETGRERTPGWMTMGREARVLLAGHLWVIFMKMYDGVLI